MLKSYSTLKKKADRLFSILRRLEESDGRGMARCCSCGVQKPWKDLQNGHFVSRVHLAARFEPSNSHPQCSACNVLRRGNPAEYAKFLIDRYGPEIINRLVSLKRQTIKFSRTDLQAMTEDYEKRIAALDPSHI